MTRHRVAGALWGVAFALLIGGVVMYVPNELAKDGVFSPQMLLVPGFATVGAMVASRTGNRIGWLYLVLGVVASITLFAGQLDERVELANWGLQGVQPVAAWLGNWTWPLNYVLLGMSLLLFPDGHLPSRRWRWVGRTFTSSWGFLVLGMMFQSEQLSLGEGEAVPNPFAIPGTTDLLELVGPVITPFAVVTLAFVAAAPLLRYRRADRIQRQQIKWLAYTLAAVLVLMLIALLVGLFSESAAGLLMVPAIPAVTVGIPAAVGMAILKHRLYDIDVVVNRALVYGLLTVVLGASYAGIVVLLQGVLEPFTADSDVAIAGSTLAVAALFRPLRTRVQAFIDRRFYRRKYDAVETLSEFSSRLRDQVNLDSLARELVGVVGATMQPAHVSIWLRGEDRPALGAW